ncbi:MAG: tRNA 5-methoxyuridine(34)/uridine 5-oxyacetic acid(34) synthase CmoB [Kangiella sp.]|nr:MAG: tRNA 5-methoxyuridine(34)/uridine 5-oxyacetic acid(34) synthase CmoB [Kangiella sp.]PHS19897.1 MAG: tRNA 5-methoxyuridine(34)/uridine 5-oxyacetic acid(34) synthase CmoB [Kangiella sp.]
MIQIKQFQQDIENSKVAFWQSHFVDSVQNRYNNYTHGEVQEWQELLQSLPEFGKTTFDLESQVQINLDDNKTLSESQLMALTNKLKQLHPWRKGPYRLFDIHIDTEWRSDWKWDRIKSHISPLKGKTILDVGCGNGYHCWRMLGEGAQFVLGVDPSQKFLAQFAIMQKYIQINNCHLLPLGIEDMPKETKNCGFDSVFCMGVLYHRKSPVEMLYQLKDLLLKGGELILETLVIEGNDQKVLVPKGRYAQMRNVWFLPSVDALILWLTKCGFKDVRCINVEKTSTDEQRTTDWMTFHSLENFLMPDNKNLTVEGYPAPLRATLIAKKP